MASLEERLPYLLMLPAGVIFAIFVVYPVWGTIELSFFKVEGTSRIFVGFGNYWRMVNDPLFWNALKVTVLWLLIHVLGKPTIALGFALFLNEEFRGRRWIDAVVFLPFVLPIPMVAVIWRWVLAGTYGYVNSILLRMGLITEGIPFLAYPISAFMSINICGVWMGIPFYTLFFHSALKGIPETLYEAAKIDGSTSWQRFWYVTLPQLRGIFLINLIIATLISFNAFPVVWPMTGGGPLYSTDMLVTFLYREAFSYVRPGYASAISVFSFIFLAVISVVYVKMYFKE